MSVLIDKSTRLLVQGLTGREGTFHAKAAQAYLVSKGIAADRITTVSYGEERPACTEKTQACWAKNRRDQFLVKEK